MRTAYFLSGFASAIIIITQMQKVVEYVWIDGFGSVRSKTRVASSEVDTVDRVSCWNYDGSSTRQALLNNSEIILRPVKVVKDPFRRPNGLIALCQTEVGDGQPARLNFRMACEKVAKMAEKHKVWFGLEQEYYFLEKSGVVVDYIPGSSANKGMYYCGVGHHSKRLRKVTDLHLEYCLYAGVQLSGLNAEVSVGQWEFQVGTCVGIEAADDLILARYILIRLAEDF
jgi:glutamine synthetase